jgi:hypothetical protein
MLDFLSKDMGYGRRRTHRQQLTYNRNVLIILTTLGVGFALGIAYLAFIK